MTDVDPVPRDVKPLTPVKPQPPPKASKGVP